MKVQTQINNSTIRNPNSELPRSWRWVRLGEVCSIYPGQHILESDYNRGRVGVGYLTGPADFGETYPSVTKWTERPKAWCEPGDVLVTVKGAGVGKSNLAPNEQVAIGRQLMAIRPKPELMEQRFLYYVVIIHFSKLQAKSVGSTVPGLGRKDIETLEISLPPFHEQKRIAAKIQELMQEVERARAACEKQLEAAKALPAAYLREVFESEEAKKWGKKILREILIILESGSRPKGGVFDIKEGIPSIGAEHLNSFGRFCLNNIRFIPIEFYQAMKRGKIQKKDVLVVKDGATTGKVSIVGDTFPYEKAGINEHVFRLRGEHSLLDQEFLFWFLYSTTGQSQIQQEFHGSAQGGINQKFVDGISIPIPDLHTQQRIASELKEKMARVENLRTGIEKQLEAINALPHAILKKSFRGKL